MSQTLIMQQAKGTKDIIYLMQYTQPLPWN